MKAGVSISLIILCAFYSVIVSATEVYRWRDADGKLHFSDKKPLDIASEKQKVVTTDGYSFEAPGLADVLEKGERQRSEAAEKKQQGGKAGEKGKPEDPEMPH